VTLLLLACVPPPAPPREPVDEVDPTVRAHSATSAADHTALLDTMGGHTGVPDGCAPEPEQDEVFPHTRRAIATEEDFDFDGSGLLVAQYYTTLRGIDLVQDPVILATGLEDDAAGIRVAPGGALLFYASPSYGTIVAVDRLDGNSWNVLYEVTNPRSLEMGLDGLLYVAEYTPDGRILTMDTTSRDVLLVGRLSYPNGMTLSMDEQVLYVSAGQGRSTLYAFDRQPSGRFDPRPRRVLESDGVVLSLATDVCDNLYLLSVRGGSVHRYRPDTGALRLIAELPTDDLGFSAIRFSPGIGGFDGTHLWATNRSAVFEIEVGIAGRHVLRP
jgi:hypothetical protein